MQSLQSVLSFCCPVSSSLLDTSFLFASTNIGLNIYKPWWQVFLPKPDAKAQESESSSFVLVGFGLFVSLFLNFLYLAYVVPSSCSINNCWIEYLGKRMLLLSFLFWNQQAQWMSQILCFFLSFCNHTDRPPSVRPSKKQPPPALRLPAQVVTADTVHLRASAADSRAKESDWLQRTDVILQPGLWGSTWKWNGGREW